MDVLVVDDQRPFRAVTRTLVSLLAGWRLVAEVESGEDAIVAVEAARPGLVIMDINLPGMSGIDATARILARHPDVRVVLVSTYPREELPADVLTCGAVGYVRKEDLTPHLLREITRAEPG